MAKTRSKDSPRKRSPHLDRIELESKICSLFCRGKSTTEIRKILGAEDPPIKLRPKEAWEIVQRVGRRHPASGQLQYVPLPARTLAARLEAGCAWLKRRTIVVHTAVAADIAFHAATKLLEIMRDTRTEKGPDGEFHVGFAGGGLLEQTARILAERLGAAEVEPQFLPKKLFFHAMIGRFGDDPATDPNSFAAHFTREPLQMEVRFVGLMTPGLVSAADERSLRIMDGIKEAYDKVDQLDVVVTSAGGHWEAGHSRLHLAYSERDDKVALDWLQKQGCVGDLMWGPIARSGPVQLSEHTRAMTLIRLDELADLIRLRKKKVMLVLGPCVACGKPKPEILDAVLSWQEPMITHLVVDSWTVHQLFRDHPAHWAQIE